MQGAFGSSRRPKFRVRRDEQGTEAEVSVGMNSIVLRKSKDTDRVS